VLCASITVVAQHHQPAAQASAQTNAISSKVILTQLLPDVNLKNMEVNMVVVDFPPGNIGAAHRHPGQTFGYLLEGELESVFEGKTYNDKKGDSFYEFPNGLHNSTRNPSTTITAKLLVFFINEKGKPNSVKVE
jgi:quercetin dioxygenase-like cupin family protein